MGAQRLQQHIINGQDLFGLGSKKVPYEAMQPVSRGLGQSVCQRFQIGILELLPLVEYSLGFERTV